MTRTVSTITKLQTALKSALVLVAILATAFVVPFSPQPGVQAAPDAQLGGAPLIFLKDGDLWAWNGSATEQLTTWGYNERPVLSPDGTRLAYSSWATITADAIAAGKPVMGIIPSNIWVMDVKPGDWPAFRAADQPADARFWEEGVADKVVMRSTPAWAPDSLKLAWVELLLPDFRYQLVTIDLTTRTSRVIVSNLPVPFSDAGFVGMPEPKWGSSGIALTVGAVNPNSADLEDTLYVFQPDGVQLSATLVGSSSTEWLFTFDWVRYQGQAYIGLLYPSGKDYLMNPSTGALQDMPNSLALVSAAVTPSAAATPALGGTEPGMAGQTAWTLVTADRKLSGTVDFSGGVSALSVSKDGRAIAYLADAVYIWQNGQTSQVPGTEGIAAPGQLGLVWGPNVWDAEATAGAPVAMADGMGGGLGCSPSPRLTIGGPAQVTPGLPNVIRTVPRRGTDSLIVGQIPGGATFSVLNGPQCGPEGHWWWQVNYNGMTGWTPEGQGWVYWLQPAVINPPACTMQPRLSPGTTAYVTPGLPNVIRTLPRRGADSLIVGQIPGGAFFTVLSGAQCGPEGRYWYQINYNGIVGYTAEGERGYYWLAPFGCPASPAPRLAPGMQAVVTPGAPNRLRSGPGTNYQTIGQIPGGGFFTVLSGPQCGPEGWSYWRVQYGGQIGWTAEGDGATYWLEPYQWQPIPTPTPPAPVTCSPTPRLQLGTAGRVLPGLPNVLRSQPRRSSDSIVLLEMPGSAVFGVEQGPVCGPEGRWWWKVDYQGVKGWTPEGQGSEYWLEPYYGSPPSATCLPGHLTIGATGYVIPGPSNVLRSEPTRGGTSQVIGQIPGGGWFRVLGGPQCDGEGINWWYVNYNGVIGWTGESQGTAYWANPFSCGAPLQSRLMPGIAARVTPGDPNSLRNGPGTNNAIIGQIPGGASFNVIGGPQCSGDGWIWWQVNYNGQVGWTAEGNANTYWLEPL